MGTMKMNEYDASHARKRVKPIPEPITQQEVWRLGETLQDEQDRALLYFLYLSGARITEVLQVRCRELEKRKTKLPNGKLVWTIKLNLITLKRRSGEFPRRTIYVNPMGLDQMMLAVIVNLRKTRNRGDDCLFDYGDVKSHKARWKAYHRLKKVRYAIRGVAIDGKLVELPEFGIYPHFLRHCRATHLAQDYGFNDRELMRYFGWVKSETAMIYTNLNPKEILARIIDRDGCVEAN